MSDSLFTRYYTTTAAGGDKQVTGGCRHLHADPAPAVACAVERGDTAVVVDRAGRILPDDPGLIGALSAALGAGPDTEDSA